MNNADECTKYPTLDVFVRGMVDKLDKNSHKTGWRNLPPEALKRYLEIEIQEFDVAFKYESTEVAQKELVDIANYAFILWDRLEGIRKEG